MTTPSADPAGQPPLRLAIGDVVALLRPDFPDVSISKIRFLEAEGLVTPARTGSGYRTFAGEDVQRIRYVLTAQRDRFWPLKVIRQALDALDRGLSPGADDGGVPEVPATAGDPALPGAAEIGRPDTLRLTATELRRASRLDEPTFDALAGFGLLRPDGGGHYGDAALAVARAAGALAAYGVEPRHLRSFRTAADREVGLVQQVLSSVRGRGSAAAPSDLAELPPAGTAAAGAGTAAAGAGPQAEDPVAEATADLLAHCISLHVALVRAGLQHG